MDDEVALATFIRGIYTGIVFVSSVDGDVRRAGYLYVIRSGVSIQDGTVIAAAIDDDIVTAAAVECNRDLDVRCNGNLVVTSAEIAVDGTDALEDIAASH